MDYQALADEINNDPQGLGYADYIEPDNFPEIAALLDAEDPAGATVYDPIQPPALRKYLASSGLRIPIEAAKTDTNLSNAVRSVAYQVIDFTLASDPEPLDLSNPETESLVDALSSADGITTQDISDFKSNWERPATRAEAMLGRGVTVSPLDVQEALT